MLKKLSKGELIILVQKIIDCDYTEKQINEMIKTLGENVPDPEVINLIYWNNENLTAEQIVEKALSYKPIEL
jgi:hypothetical protein